MIRPAHTPQQLEEDRTVQIDLAVPPTALDCA